MGLAGPPWVFFNTSTNGMIPAVSSWEDDIPTSHNFDYPPNEDGRTGYIFVEKMTSVDF